MTQFLSQMMKLPMAVVVYSIEMFVKTMQGMRSIADQGIDVMVGGIAQTLGDASNRERDRPGDAMDGVPGHDSKTTDQTLREEERNMPDLDLGGDDLKVVNYSIVFDKPDEEKILQPKEQDLVDYATDGGSYGGLKIAEFFDKHPVMKTTIEEKDRRYVKFIYQVERRLRKGIANYEKRKVELLKEISGKIG